jgi:membrane-associated HD superfamily phosphohydrolase
MAKAKKQEAVAIVDNSQALQEAQQKIAELQAQLAVQQEASKNIQGLSRSLTQEINEIKRKGNSTANTITVGTSRDYTPVTLWTKWGKPIGGLHPDNAIQTLQRFANVGIILSARKPTPEEATAWSNSAEGKAYWKNEAEKRAAKDKTKKAGQLEKLAAEIAKQTGTTVEALNRVLKIHEVKA